MYCNHFAKGKARWSTGTFPEWSSKFSRLDPSNVTSWLILWLEGKSGFSNGITLLREGISMANMTQAAESDKLIFISIMRVSKRQLSHTINSTVTPLTWHVCGQIVVKTNSLTHCGGQEESGSPLMRVTLSSYKEIKLCLAHKHFIHICTESASTTVHLEKDNLII